MIFIPRSVYTKIVILRQYCKIYRFDKPRAQAKSVFLAKTEKTDMLGNYLSLIYVLIVIKV